MHFVHSIKFNEEFGHGADLRVAIKSIPSLLSHLRAIVPSVPLLFSDSIEQERHAVHTVC